MQILEHGQEQRQTLLFFPCTAEPVWAFEDTIALLSQKRHVFQVVFDGHQPEYPGEFISVEQTVDEITAYLESCGIDRLDAAYGCSLGGACLTRLMALGEIPVGRAIIDGGITPYQMPHLLRRLHLAVDRNAGHEILPKADAEFESAAYRKTCLRFFKLMCATSLGKLCASDHAMNAVDEMNALNRDLKRFFDENGADYPMWRELESECGRDLS